MNRIIKNIPNSITSMNLLCGVLGVILTIEGQVSYAFPLMLAAAVFDFFDGLAARALGAYSAIGKELDSLADCVSFGVLPAVMLYKTMRFALVGGSLAYVPLLIAVFSALRLAKFNVDERQHESFLGLATPASAMICGSLSYFAASSPASAMSLMIYSPWFVPALSVVLCALMVSEIPMFSMKFSKETATLVRIKRIAFLSIAAIVVIIVVALGLNWSLAIFMIFAAYVVMNLIFSLSPSTR